MKPEVMISWLRGTHDDKTNAASIVCREIADWIEQNNAVVEGLREEPAELAALSVKLAAAERERDEALKFAAKGLDAIEALTRERDDALAGVARQAKLLDHYASESAKLRTERDEAVEALNNTRYERVEQRATPPTVYTVDIEKAARDLATKREGVLPQYGSGDRADLIAAILRKHARAADAEALAAALWDVDGHGRPYAAREPHEDGRPHYVDLARAALAHLGLALAAKPAPWKVDREKVVRAVAAVWTDGFNPCTDAAIKEIERQLSSTAPNSIGAGFVPDFGAIGAAFLKGMGDWTDGARAAFTEIERQRAEAPAPNTEAPNNEWREEPAELAALREKLAAAERSVALLTEREAKTKEQRDALIGANDKLAAAERDLHELANLREALAEVGAGGPHWMNDREGANVIRSMHAKIKETVALLQTAERERDEALAGVARQAKLLDHYASESAGLRTERDEARAALTLSGSGGNRPTHFQGERVEAWLDATKWAEHRTEARGSKAIVALAQRYDEARNETRAALNQIDRMLATPPTVQTVDIEAAAGEIVTVGVTPPFSSGGRHYEVSCVAEMIRKHARPADAEALAKAMYAAADKSKHYPSWETNAEANKDEWRCAARAALAHLGLALAEKPAPFVVDREKVHEQGYAAWGREPNAAPYAKSAAVVDAAIREIERQRAEGGAS